MSRTGFRSHRRSPLVRCLVGAIAMSMPIASPRAMAVSDDGPTTAVDVQLKRSCQAAGDNSGEIRRAMVEAPPGQRAAMRWLIIRMPEEDLRTFTAERLLENSRLAFEAMEAAPWKDTVPEEVFRDGVLPYAVVNERRDDW